MMITSIIEQFFQFRMSSNNSPATKTDRRKSKRKSCIEIIASAKIVRDVDPDTTDPLKVMFFYLSRDSIQCFRMNLILNMITIKRTRKL